MSIMVAEEVRSQVKKALEALKLPSVEVELEHPKNEKFGDRSSNIAMTLFAMKELSLKNKDSPYRNPRELAEAIAKKLRSYKLQAIKKVEVAGPGFINFYLSEQYLLSEVGRALNLGKKYGTNSSGKGKKIMVEYAHPNTHKEFHIGHMRNICLGESLCRIFEANGIKVIRVNYQGDVGLHVAKAVWGAKKLGLPKDSISLSKRVQFLGKAYVEGHRAYSEDKKAKVEIKDMNEAIYKGEESVKPLWEKTRKWSLEYFDWIYKRVYTKFDRLYFEGEVAGPGKKISKEALKKGILTKSEGAIVFDGSKYGLDTRVFLTKDDLPTYEAKELGVSRLEFTEFGEIDRCIHVVAPEQTSFFKVTFKVEELLDVKKYKDKQEHFVYGYVNLKKGKMSSRAGTIVTGEWLLDEAKKRVEKIMEQGNVREKSTVKSAEIIAEMVGVGAVKYSMLKVSPRKDIAFDFDESINLEGDSGPYLQYTYARAKSVLEKSKLQTLNSKQIINSKSKFKIFDISIKNAIVSNQEERAIIRWIYKYPEVVLQAGNEYAPNAICGYLYDLAQRFNSFYNKHRIIKGKNEKEVMSNEQSRFRLALTVAVARILENGLDLLGIRAPAKM